MNVDLFFCCFSVVVGANIKHSNEALIHSAAQHSELTTGLSFESAGTWIPSWRVIRLGLALIRYFSNQFVRFVSKPYHLLILLSAPFNFSLSFHSLNTYVFKSLYTCMFFKFFLASSRQFGAYNINLGENDMKNNGFLLLVQLWYILFLI